MGCDMHFLEERVRKHNGGLAQKVLSEIIDVIDDDKPFKEARIERLVDKYKNNKKSV